LEAWELAMLKTTATTTILRDRHTMAPIVLTALWRLCLLAAAITQTRSIITKSAFNHPRPSSTGDVFNWSRSRSPRITHSAWRPNWPRPAARVTPQHAGDISSIIQRCESQAQLEARWCVLRPSGGFLCRAAYPGAYPSFLMGLNVLNTKGIFDRFVPAAQ
jgi:hypothetical protein